MSRWSTASRFVLWLMCAISAPAVGVAQQVVINEIHYNPMPGVSPDAEFVEFHNPGVTPVDLSGWSITDAVVFTFPASTTLPAGGYVVVARSIAQLQIASGYTASFQFTSGSLSNGGELIRLRDSSTAIIDELTYDDDHPWPISPDGSGPSLELLSPDFDNAVASVWRASSANNGTPGAANSVFSSNPVILNETPMRGGVIQGLPSVTITFAEAVTGVAAADLLVDGSPATLVTGSGAGPYVFSGYSAPLPGTTAIELLPGAIVDGAANSFQGDSWQYLFAALPRIVINEIHYHPSDLEDPSQSTEFFELFNDDTTTVSLANWTVSNGVVYTFPPGTQMMPGSYLVVAVNPAALEAETGFAGALGWSSGSLANGGERLSISNQLGAIIDDVDYDDAGVWPTSPDGLGPSLELVSPGLPNEFGLAWRASLANNGTPGAVNGVYVADPAPILTNPHHTPSIPAANAPVTITVSMIADNPGGTAVLLHHRMDQTPKAGYVSIVMLDDGMHGDGAAGDGAYGVTVPGLAEGQRMDFYITADDGAVATIPTGHATLDVLGHPSQTFLCKFTSAAPVGDFPTYHIITTDANRAAQEGANPPLETEYDATFIDNAGNVFYNVTERYRGSSSLLLDPKSFRVNFSDQQPLDSEFGFPITRLQLMSQFSGRQMVAYQGFDAALLMAPQRQYVRVNVNPSSNIGNINGTVYINVERVDDEFLSRRFDPDDATGNLYRGREDADFRWEGPTLGPPPTGGPYRIDATETLGYEKITNEAEDNWNDLLTICDALTCANDSGVICSNSGNYSDPSFAANISALIDEDQWCRWFAMQAVMANQEGGLYRDTGDDYFVYFHSQTGAVYPDIADYRAILLPWDMDSALRFGTTDTIWRVNVPAIQRLLRHNAFAPIFVSNIRSLIDNEMSVANVHARINAVPATALSNSAKNAMRNFYTSRVAFINGEIISQLTLNGVPAGPYFGPNPVLNLSGTLNQAGTFAVHVNGVPATHSCFAGTWSASFTLVPGMNAIVVQALGRNGEEIGRVERSVEFDLCPTDPAKFEPGQCGCGTPDTDSDNDGTADCNDGCPIDPAKVAPGLCGCGTPDTDTDGDLTPDCNDGCPNDPAKTAPGLCGCGTPETDTDGDLTPDCNDGCPLDPAKTAPGVCGCGVPDVDTDGDSVLDCNDGCPNDPLKTSAGACGCGTPDIDSDGDLTLDCFDGCPLDPLKTEPGPCGCGELDTDSDGDLVPDCNDGCPDDPLKSEPGQCGCGAPETDFDGDGVADCVDGCPADPLKSAPGQCGCGVPDTDSDNDGTSDCNDGCPNDPAKTEPGLCGCGIADTDSDNDATPDCHDGCPLDPNKTNPGVCGCGVPDLDSDNDGTFDCFDGCPLDPAKTNPGQCGCGNLETDTDADGTADCNDLCPMDPEKTEPGECGCGVPEGDLDVDGIPDCDDTCPGVMVLAAPARMIAGNSLTLRVNILDSDNNINRNIFSATGHLRAERLIDGAPVQISTTVFDEHDGPTAPRTMRFHNGVGVASIVLDQGTYEPAADIRLFVRIGGVESFVDVEVINGGPERVLTGVLSGENLHWSPADILIHITGSVTVPVGETLTIEPGTQIMLDSGPPGGGTRIIVEGQIIADGTPEQPISFFAEEAEAAMVIANDCMGTTWNPHSWRGIIHRNNGSSVYDHVYITGAGNGPNFGLARSPILQASHAASITITNSVIADSNGKALYASGTGRFVIADSVITRCGNGLEFAGDGLLTIDLTNTWITATGHGSPDCGRTGDLINIRCDDPPNAPVKNITNCILADAGDDCIGLNGASVHITDCIMYDAPQTGISMRFDNPATAVVTNTLMFDTRVHSVRALGGTLDLSNCTFISEAPFDAPSCTLTTIHQSIIWPAAHDTCCGIADHSVFGAGSDLTCGSGSVAVDPMFVDAAQLNFDLALGSPALTVGEGGTRAGWVPIIAPAGQQLCPGDWNRDCALDSQDFFDFLDDFFNGQADFNRYDGTDSQDYFDFLDAFFVGC